MIRRLYCTGVLLLVAAGGLAGQQPETGVPEPAAESLFRETLARDIATAGFYELVAWLESLGLSTQGDRATLANRLADFYGIQRDRLERERSRLTAGDRPPLVVDDASRTRYFTIDEIDERYIRLSGGVVLTLRDEENDALHRVRADEISFNQEQNTLAASGSVVYILERGGTTEQFTGEALTVELDSWEGAFVRGVTERERTIEGERIDFAFAGTYITRSRDDVIVLDDGTITSSEAVPPNYRIRARRIWVLAPGEWGLSNAFLYVGRVPLLYLPFFFRPGNELFLNPAFGSRDRSGIFIQTTTYLRGEPEDETSAFSLLQLADDDEEGSRREIDGLFLVPVDRAGTDPESGVREGTIRVLADLYTKLGAHVAFDADLPEFGPLGRTELYAGLAASRHIYITDYPGAGREFTPYLVADGLATQSWNETVIGEATLPFRFALDLASSITLDRLSGSLAIEYYSDPRFLADFGDRAERIDWLALAGQGGTTTAPGPVSSLRWRLDGSWRADVSEVPLVDQLSLQGSIVDLSWRTRQINSALLAPEVLEADASPEASFFYPESVRLPDLSASLSGTVVRWPLDRDAPTDDQAENDREKLIPPWEADQVGSDADTAVEGTDARSEESDVVVPAVQPALPAPALPELFAGSLRYSLAPTLLSERFFLDEPWELPEQVDFGVAYAGLSMRSAGSLGYDASLAAGTLRLDGSFASSAQYRTVFDRDPLLDDARWQTLERQAWAFTSFTATNTTTLRYQPFRTSRLWSGSNLSYSLGTLLYRIVFDEIVGGEPTWRNEVFEWEEQYVTQHQVQATAALALGGSQSLALTATLPPRDERYTARFAVTVDPLSLSVSGGVRRGEEEWTFDPVASTQTVTPWERVRLTNTLSYDVEAEELAFSRASLAVGPASGQLEVRTTEGFTFGGPGVGWQPDGEERLRPTSASFSLSLDSDFDPWWRNRILLELESDLQFNSNLLRFTEGTVRFVFSGSLVIHRFMRLTLASTSVNSQGYVYVATLAERVGRQPRNVLVDLARSFNFFDRQARLESGFDLQTIRLDLVHDLGDWDLTLSYTGRPELETDEGTTAYVWRGSLDLTVQWRPIAELATSVFVDEDEVRFGDDS